MNAHQRRKARRASLRAIYPDDSQRHLHAWVTAARTIGPASAPLFIRINVGFPKGPVAGPDVIILTRDGHLIAADVASSTINQERT